MQLKKLCDEGKLQKYENGIYYLPKKSRLKTNVGVNADTVARYKYVSRGGKVDGFYSGNTFANQLGISTQVPNKVEIVSNNMAAKVREVPIETRFVKGILFSKIQFQNHYMAESVLTSGAVSFFIKTYTILVSIAGPFSPLNTFSGIMALQERNEVNNYEHYKCGEKI
ncbi:DUF6088 family protein [bacterium 210820-DFI.6.38]|nr:DUF6088 family protein [bacterium 210820-DFI.6.38]